jgi:hypothetical protein
VGGHQSFVQRIEGSASGDIDVLIFVVARTRLHRYEELRHDFGDWRDVRIILDRREGDRREPHDPFAGVERRGAERRQRQLDLRKLGWSVVDTNDIS